MSELKFTNADPGKYTLNTFSIFRNPPYECPVHGVVENLGTLSLNKPDGSVISQHCMLCYQNWIAENIPVVRMLK